MTEIDESLIGKEVRVIFDDPGVKQGKVWKGCLTNVTAHFIELTMGGRKSYVGLGWIIALMEWIPKDGMEESDD